MEDLSDSMRLMDILQPEVAKTQSQRKSADTMEVRKTSSLYFMNFKKFRKLRKYLTFQVPDSVFPSFHDNKQ